MGSATLEPETLYPNDIPEPPPEGQQLLERKHIAYLLGVELRTVGTMTSKGKIPGAMSGIGGHGTLRRYVRSTVEAWIAAGCPVPARWPAKWK